MSNSPETTRSADLSDPALWLRAEADHAPALARAAAALGALDALVEDCPWLLPRLALVEAEAMLWTQGILLRREDIGRDLLAARSGADAEGLTQARWSVRRLVPAPGLSEVQNRARDLRDLRRFLGLHRVEIAGLGEDLSQRACGDDFDSAAAAFTKGLDAFEPCHPITRAAAALPLWRRMGLSPVEDAIESASFTAILAAVDLPYLPFAPLGQHGPLAWRASGSAGARLDLWFNAVHAGALEARAELRRLKTWRTEALAQVTKLKGDTPARLIDFALTRPLIGTEDAELGLGMSRDSAERGLARLQSLGILREVTGRGRFRLWTTAR